ncbi:MAG: hypothetical protein KGI25_00005, partial [Thaumarchaeota archaeon]|nr:hypothetical protein [Nitrososphaerota archaeon]
LGVYAQIVVKDASGNLVSYIESSNTRLLVSAAQFNQILNQNLSHFKKTELNANGQNIEILQVNNTLVHKDPTIVSLNIISLGTPSGPQILVIANHDGFPVVAGDKMTVYWTIVRSNG